MFQRILTALGLGNRQSQSSPAAIAAIIEPQSDGELRVRASCGNLNAVQRELDAIARKNDGQRKGLFNKRWLLPNDALADVLAELPQAQIDPKYREALERHTLSFAKDWAGPSLAPSEFGITADRLDEWWLDTRVRFPKVTLLVIDLDNGPENHSRRTQFMKRMVEFTQLHHIDVRLAYYPPYHSKYNPIERCWGILEQHWNGSLLDSLDAVVGFAETMTWNGHAPIVKVINQVYHIGVRLTQSLMAQVETHLSRFETLSRWFVDIPWQTFSGDTVT